MVQKPVSLFVSKESELLLLAQNSSSTPLLRRLGLSGCIVDLLVIILSWKLILLLFFFSESYTFTGFAFNYYSVCLAPLFLFHRCPLYCSRLVRGWMLITFLSQLFVLFYSFTVDDPLQSLSLWVSFRIISTYLFFCNLNRSGLTDSQRFKELFPFFRFIIFRNHPIFFLF